MINNIEYNFINPELVEIENIKIKTIRDYIKNYGNSYWEKLENIYKIQFFDKIKNKEKNVTTERGVKKTIIASNRRYEYIEINKFIILIKRDIKKNVISTYMKCGNILLLCRKIFLNSVNNRDHIIKYCNRPFYKSDRLCREWYLGHNSDDNEIRVVDDNLNNIYMLMW